MKTITEKTTAKNREIKSVKNENANQLFKREGRSIFKRASLIFALMVFGILGFAQNTQMTDVITLNDSSVYTGTIIENVINDYISIRTSDGQIKVIKYPDIKKMEKGKPLFDLDEYGGDLSLGVALGGGGLAGVSARYFLTDKIPFEFGIHMRPILYDIGGSPELSWNKLFAGSFNYYLSKKMNEYKERVQMNGLVVKAGYHTGEYTHGTIVAFGWAYERFKIHQKNNSVSFELGVGIDFLTDKKMDEYYSEYGYNPNNDLDINTVNPMIYWKVAWNFFVIK